MYYLCFFLLFIILLVEVSFFTLFERSVLGYVQFRSGPQSIGFQGLVQPFGDALSLFSKEFIFPFRCVRVVYLFTPFVGVILSLVVWFIYPFLFCLSMFYLSLFYFICVSSIYVYVLLSLGWSSSSVYAMLGCMRALAQTISYEVSLMAIMMSLMFLICGFDILDFTVFQYYVWFVFFLFPLVVIFVSSLLAETNRAPFDFAEAESELVSGFNVEYSGGGFAFIFMSEYLHIMMASLLVSVFFLGGNLLSFEFYVSWIFVAFVFVWVRASFPRYRYDSLMGLAWSVYLPICLNLMFVFMFVSYYAFVFILLSKVNKSI